MNPPSKDISDMLVAGSLSLVVGTNLFIGREPEAPNDCVTIFDTPGHPPEMYYSNEYRYFYPSIQIRVRDIEYLEGWDLINDIKLLLHNRGQETWNGTLYSAIACTIEPALLDWDQNNRARFVTTFDIQRH